MISLEKSMFGFWNMLGRHIRQLIRSELPYFSQYVGDETLLIYSRDGLFVYLDGRDASLTPSLLLHHTWEPHIGAFIDRTLVPGGCFVDIGANNGIHTLRAGRKVGETGVVVAFEPQERLYQLVQRSICANLLIYHVHPRRMAIGAAPGTASLGKLAHFTGSATMTPNNLVVEREEVPMAPLSEALSQVSAEIGRACIPDLIKIDVEGYEYDVWDGMKEWAREQASLSIIVEYSPLCYRNIGRDSLLLLEEFVEYGFEVEALNADGSTRPVMSRDFAGMASSDRQFDLVLVKRPA